MRTFFVHAGDRVVVNRCFSVKITRVDGNQIQLELDVTDGNAVSHVEITRAQPPNQSGNRPPHGHRNGRNPYGMGKPHHNGNGHSQKNRTAAGSAPRD